MLTAPSSSSSFISPSAPPVCSNRRLDFGYRSLSALLWRLLQRRQVVIPRARLQLHLSKNIAQLIGRVRRALVQNFSDHLHHDVVGAARQQLRLGILDFELALRGLPAHFRKLVFLGGK